MRKLIVEMTTSQTTHEKRLFGSVFNILVSKELIEKFQDLTDVSVIINKNMKIDKGTMEYLSQSKVKMIMVSNLSEINRILKNYADSLYFSPMNLHGVEFIPPNVKTASVIHDIRDFLVYSSAYENIENEKMYYAINKFTSLNNIIAYLLSHLLPRIYGKIMKRRGEKWLSIFLDKLQRTDGLIFNSFATKKKVMEVCHSKLEGIKTEVIYPPVNRIEVKDPAHLLKDVPKYYFLMLSVCRKEKNLHVVLEAFSKFCQKEIKKPYYLVLTGATRQLERFVKRKTKFSERIICFPYSNQWEIDQLIAKSSALLMPSIDEGFGHPIMEAMNLGVPVVCSDLPIFREISNQYSIFFNHNDSWVLSEILYNISEDEYKEKNSSAAKTMQGLWYKEETKVRLDKISSFVLSLLVD